MAKLRVAMDTCVILDAILKNQHWPEVEPIFDDARLGKVEIVVSEITVAEAHKLLDANGNRIADDVTIIQEFFDNPYFLRRPVGRVEAEQAAKIIRKHELDTCDAVIAATAVEHDATTLYTRDGYKKKRKPGKLLSCDGLLGGSTKLEIKIPVAADYLQMPLLMMKKDDQEDE